MANFAAGMEATKTAKRNIREPHRLVLMREDTLEEVGSYRLTALNVYLLICTALVVVTLLVLALIFFTPIKRLVPGYGDIKENRVYVELNDQVLDLEKQVEAQQLYIDRFRELLTASEPAGSPANGSQVPDRSTVSGDALGIELPVAADQKPETMRSGSAGESNPLMDALSSTSSGQAVANVKPTHVLDEIYIIPPLRGSVSDEFDAEVNHLGVDLLAPKDTPVQAILDGYVIVSDWSLESGNTIGIQHADDVISFYKHCSKNLKKLGAFVQAGEAVAIIGNTGEFTTGPHLHFELWVDGKPIDPATFIDLR